MYRGFNLTGLENLKNDASFNTYWNRGNELYKKISEEIAEHLDKYVLPQNNNVIDASLIQRDWFPCVKADVFISHSRANQNLAIALAGMLNDRGITAFIDSCIWGYCDNLLKQIDNEYCLTVSNTYSYQKRNYSTSHVHMMLTNALMEMMDKTECVIFMQTSESVVDHNYGINTKTYSPWIFHEIALTKYLRVNLPDRFRQRQMNENMELSERSALDEFPKFSYDIDLSNLTEIKYDQLKALFDPLKNQKSWIRGLSQNISLLDKLYQDYVF